LFQETRPKIGLVLGSGGVKCAAAVGLWKVLQREGWQIDLAVGCSGGALYAAAMALGWDRAEAEAKSAHLWAGTLSRVNYAGLIKAILARRLGWERWGLMDDSQVNSVIFDLFGEITFDQTRCPLRVVATDLQSGEPVVISHGRIADAIRASSAIPFMLPPWLLDGRLLMDGGTSDPLPIDVAVREGCDIVLAMGFENPHPPALDSLLSLLEQTSHIVVNNLIRTTMALYGRAHRAVILITPKFDRHIRMDDAGMVPSIIAAGERAALEQLPLLRQLMASPVVLPAAVPVLAEPLDTATGPS
jgi:NTE family protein